MLYSYSFYLTKSFFTGNARLGAALAAVLLLVQILLPWTVPHFVTQDGPSHVYSAVTARDLLLHRDSLQRLFYHFRPGAVPNWTATILLAVIATVAGAGNAERVMVDLIVVLGFFAFRYAARAFAGRPVSATPLANFLVNTWFLWLGFFNFTLGMGLCCVVVGYFVRHRHTATTRQMAALSAAGVLLFFTHLIPSALAVLSILTIALWTHGKAVFERSALSRTLGAVAAMLPTIVLIAVYGSGQPPVEWGAGAWDALAGFPMHIFATAAGRIGGQDLLVPGVLFFIVVAIIGLHRSEWRSEKGALVAVMSVCFLLYLVVPDQGFGGSEARIRFGLGVYVLGGLVAASAESRPIEKPMAICIAVLLSCNLFATWQALALTSRAAADYLSLIDRIPRGAVFIRAHYPTPHVSERYGLAHMGRDPFFHLEADSAARRSSVDLSDYEGLNPIFALAIRPKFEQQRPLLYMLEGPGEYGASCVTRLRDNLPVPFDYVVVVSDGDADAATPGLAALVGMLQATMRPYAASPDNFVRIYRRQ